MTWILEMSGRLPASMNQRERSSHWVRASELKAIADELGLLALAAKVPTAQGKRSVKVTLHKSLRSRKRDDPANRDSRAKSILDALVRLGYLVDDDDSHLLWLGVHEGERRALKATIVELGECS